MTTTVPQPDPRWHATGQIDAFLDTTMPGTAVPSQEVYFQLDDSGIISSVPVPNSKLDDLAYVRSQIAAKARQLAAITTLASG